MNQMPRKRRIGPIANAPVAARAREMGRMVPKSPKLAGKFTDAKPEWRSGFLGHGVLSLSEGGIKSARITVPTRSPARTRRIFPGSWPLMIFTSRTCFAFIIISTTVGSRTMSSKSIARSSDAVISGMRTASLSVNGFAVYRPSTFFTSIRFFAPRTSAARNAPVSVRFGGIDPICAGCS